jgi:sulfonate transport system substrate-binding protein
VQKRSFSATVWSLFVLPMLLVSILSGCTSRTSSTGSSSTDPSTGVTVNIGVQQSIGPLWLAKEKGWFDQAFAKADAHVHWVEFQSGPPYFQAIAANRLDFGQVGNTPVIVGQAAGVGFKEIGITGTGRDGDAIIVPKGSSIRSLHDLKGKKIAVAKGSAADGLLYVALSKAGIQPSEVNIVPMQPNEAQAAFDSHAVDAWAIWDPFITIETKQRGAHILANARSLDILVPGFTVVRTQFAKEHPDLVVLFLKVYQQAIDWQNQHLDQAIDTYYQARKIDKSVIRTVIENSQAESRPVTPEVVASQQTTANFLYKMGEIKQRVDVSKVVDNSYIAKAK